MPDLSLTDLDGRSWAAQEMAWALVEAERLCGEVMGNRSFDDIVAQVAVGLFRARINDRALAQYDANTD